MKNVTVRIYLYHYFNFSFRFSLYNSGKIFIIKSVTEKIEDEKRMICERSTKTSELAERLRTELLARRLPSGSPVTSVRELASRYGVSTVTADRILNLLVKEDFLYRIPQSGTFIKHDPPVVPVIGYAGHLPGPGATDIIQAAAAKRLQEHLTQTGVEQHIISYHELRHPELVERKLDALNGLLISAAFIDEVTRPVLWRFKGRIVVFANTYIMDRLPCSQVIPDYTRALTEFTEKYDPERYERIQILSAGHPNAVASERNIRNILQCLGVSAGKIETLNLKGINNLSAQMAALRYFSGLREDLRNTLVLSLSGYFSIGMREVFRNTEEMPDILSFDNLEEYAEPSPERPFFTAVDCRMPDIYQAGADLLTHQITEQDERNQIIQIPARLVVRDSIRHCKR